MLHTRDIAVAAFLGSLIERLGRGESPTTWAWADTFEPSIKSEIARFQSPSPDLPTSPPANRWAPIATPPFDPLLLRIHTLVRSQPWERELWEELLHLGAVPPDPILEDFLARDLCVDTLGHFMLADAWLWRLADRVPEARLTLGKRRWVDPLVTADRVEEVLHAFPDDEWLIGSLLRLDPSDDEKARALLRYLPRLPEARRTYHWAAASARMRQAAQH